jgi:hypothetical protein
MAVTHGLEGWCTDPMEMHEERWLSWGEPTRLVRDHGVESSDEPHGPEMVEAIAVQWGEPASSGEDLLRTHDRVTDKTQQSQRISLAVLTGISLS